MHSDRKELWTEPMLEELDIADRTELDPAGAPDAGAPLGIDPGTGS